MNFPILTLLTFLPLVGAIVIALSLISKGKSEAEKAFSDRSSRILALIFSFATFVVSLILYFNFNKNTSKFQFTEKFEWLEGSKIYYYLGVDGISIYLILLTTLLIPICILSSWNSIEKRVKEYMILFLLLETLVIGVFVSLDFLLFYFFFEASLIPMFIIIGVWGAENRVYASYKFFLYTLLGSLFLLIAIIYLYQDLGTTNIVTLTRDAGFLIPKDVQNWLWLAFFASFAVKVPMFPFHTWLP
ncbi:MAG: NADH-quinone oxidoreductase subunit M, partial [Rickettsiales bacterium]|nr:NADH-quinone oxidoreductase subunit M [Rickettsiales bacterium]